MSTDTTVSFIARIEDVGIVVGAKLSGVGKVIIVSILLMSMKDIFCNYAKLGIIGKLKYNRG